MSTINLIDVFHIERRGPSYGDRSVTLHFFGKSPGGKDLKISILLPDYGIDSIGTLLNDAIKEHERILNVTKSALRGDL